MSQDFALVDYHSARKLAQAAGHTCQPDFNTGTVIVDGLSMSLGAFRAYATGLTHGNKLPRHAGSCSNQNAAHPLGVFFDAQECGCNAT